MTGGDSIPPVLGLCHVRDGRLARAQMFYFDTADVVRFPAAGNLALDRENPIPKRRRWSQADVLNVGTMPEASPCRPRAKAHREARTDDESECRMRGWRRARWLLAM